MAGSGPKDGFVQVRCREGVLNKVRCREGVLNFWTKLDAVRVSWTKCSWPSDLSLIGLEIETVCVKVLQLCGSFMAGFQTSTLTVIMVWGWEILDNIGHHFTAVASKLFPFAQICQLCYFTSAAALAFRHPVPAQILSVIGPAMDCPVCNRTLPSGMWGTAQWRERRWSLDDWTCGCKEWCLVLFCFVWFCFVLLFCFVLFCFVFCLRLVWSQVGSTRPLYLPTACTTWKGQGGTWITSTDLTSTRRRKTSFR